MTFLSIGAAFFKGLGAFSTTSTAEIELQAPARAQRGRVIVSSNFELNETAQTR
jgi:hypothetical protein